MRIAIVELVDRCQARCQATCVDMGNVPGQNLQLTGSSTFQVEWRIW